MTLVNQRADVPVTIDESLCIEGCTLCVDICPLDSLAINPDNGKAYMHVDECWYCGPVRRPLSHRRRHRQHALLDPLRTRQMMKTLIDVAPPARQARAAGLTVTASGCSLDSASESSGDVVNVVIGYQSKTINTVTAGTLLKAQGFLERRLADITTRTGTKYNVDLAGLRHRRARSPRRWSPRRSTSARWATTRC